MGRHSSRAEWKSACTRRSGLVGRMAQTENYPPRDVAGPLAPLARILLRKLLRHRRMDYGRRAIPKSRFGQTPPARREPPGSATHFRDRHVPDIIEEGDQLAIQFAFRGHRGRCRASRTGGLLADTARQACRQGRQPAQTRARFRAEGRQRQAGSSGRLSGQSGAARFLGHLVRPLQGRDSLVHGVSAQVQRPRLRGAGRFDGRRRLEGDQSLRRAKRRSTIVLCWATTKRAISTAASKRCPPRL